MSIPVVVWVMEHSEETLGRRLVLLALAEFAHDDGSKAFPSVATLMRRSRLSRRAVQTALRGLEASGSIERTGETRAGTSIYTVVMGGAESARGGADHDEEGARSTTSGGADLAPDPLGTLEPDPSLSADEPPKLRKIDGRNLGYDALAEVCGISEGSPRANSIATALNGSRTAGPGIRRLVWTRFLNDLARETIVEEEAYRDFEEIIAGEIRRRAALYRERFRDAEMTPIALAKWWLDLKTKPRTTPDARPVEEALALPEVSEEERRANAARAREMLASIGRDVE